MINVLDLFLNNCLVQVKIIKHFLITNKRYLSGIQLQNFHRSKTLVFLNLNPSLMKEDEKMIKSEEIRSRSH